jgi:hypothetical protein
MQIKFLTLYHNFDNDEYSRIQAQDSLLYMWQRSLQLRNMKFISTAKVEFKEYSFFDYPDQEKAKKEIANAYGHKDKKTKAVEYWWGGEQYTDFDTLFKALAEQKQLMELTITLE